MAVGQDIFEAGALRVEKHAADTELRVVLSGKSIIRSANEVLLPVLLEALTGAQGAGKRLVLDFRPLTYMNSSSFAPVIKVLEKARLGGAHLQVLYSSEQKWQEVSFAAMRIFSTPDGRISVQAAANG
jgi:anti-anti-sigma regulatory factor